MGKSCWSILDRRLCIFGWGLGIIRVFLQCWLFWNLQRSACLSFSSARKPAPLHPTWSILFNLGVFRALYSDPSLFIVVIFSIDSSSLEFLIIFKVVHYYFSDRISQKTMLYSEFHFLLHSLIPPALRFHWCFWGWLSIQAVSVLLRCSYLSILCWDYKLEVSNYFDNFITKDTCSDLKWRRCLWMMVQNGTRVFLSCGLM